MKFIAISFLTFLIVIITEKLLNIEDLIVSTLVGLALAPATFGLSAGATIFFGSLSLVDSCIGWS